MSRGKQEENRKGRDIGYALAAYSCEGANSVETCTVTALDAITAFAVPNPNASSQSTLDFSGLETQRVAPPSRSLSLLWTGSVLLCQPFRPSTPATLTERSQKSTQIFGAVAFSDLCITQNGTGCMAGSYPQGVLISPVFAQMLHRMGAGNKNH